eukprot:g29159.t1
MHKSYPNRCLRRPMIHDVLVVMLVHHFPHTTCDADARVFHSFLNVVTHGDLCTNLDLQDLTVGTTQGAPQNMIMSYMFSDFKKRLISPRSLVKHHLEFDLAMLM